MGDEAELATGGDEATSICRRALCGDRKAGERIVRCAAMRLNVDARTGGCDPTAMGVTGDGGAAVLLRARTTGIAVMAGPTGLAISMLSRCGPTRRFRSSDVGGEEAAEGAAAPAAAAAAAGGGEEAADPLRFGVLVAICSGFFFVIGVAMAATAATAAASGEIGADRAADELAATGMGEDGFDAAETTFVFARGRLGTIASSSALALTSFIDIACASVSRRVDCSRR